MATSDKLQVIATKLQESYTAAQAKGATMPAHQGINQLPVCIESIPTTSVTPIVTDAFKSQDVLAAMQSMYDPAYPHMIGYMLDTTATSITLPYSCDKLIKSDTPNTPIYDANGTYAFDDVPGSIYKFVILFFTTAHKTQKLVAIGSATELVSVGVYNINVNGISAFTLYNRMHTIIFSAGCQLVGNIDPSAFQGCNLMLYRLEFPAINTPLISVGDNTFNLCKLPNVKILNAGSIGSNVFSNSVDIMSVNLPNCSSVGVNAIYVCANIKSAVFGILTNLGSGLAQICPNLISITIGSNTDISLNFAGWSPTTVLADNGLKAQMIANIKTGIVDMVKDNTALTARTITFSAGVRNAIRGSAAESTLVAKNWNISPA